MNKITIDRDIETIHLGILFTLFVIELILFYVTIKRYENRDNSNIVAHLIRLTSDIETNTIRNYISTGQQIYQTDYLNAIDIKEGKKPWGEYPENVLLPGNLTRSMDNLLNDGNFSTTEKQYIKQAKIILNEIIWVEIEALNWFEGFEDTPGKDALKEFRRMKNKKFIRFGIKGEKQPKKAIKHLYSEKYLIEKEKIRILTNKIEKTVNERTRIEVNNINFILKIFTIICIVAILVKLYLYRTQQSSSLKFLFI